MKRLLFFLLALPLLAHGQLLEVKQVIYGMDCAPCARGVEASIKRLEEVESVKISLNDGTADIRLAPENRQTLGRIRQRISDNGFTAKDAGVNVTGTLRQRDGELVLQTDAGETFVPRLTSGKEIELAGLQKTRSGSSVTVAGIVPEVKKISNKPWDIQITRVDAP